MKTCEHHGHSNRFNRPGNKIRSILVGIALLVVGGIIVGNKLGYVADSLFNILISWQSLLITLGIMNLTSRKSFIPGIILIIVGGAFLLPEIFTFGVDVSNLILPAILIIIGLIVIVKAFFKPKHDDFEKHFSEKEIDFSEDVLNEKYVFGGTNLHIKSQNFKGGKLEATFGGGKIDLSQAVLSTEGKNYLDVNLVFGGFEIIVPRDWNIVIQTSSILGGFNIKNGISSESIDFSKELIIRGNAVFGGAEIKRA
ncbi:MAG: hypothetical protein JXL97_10105 [Bacteroidales bacterium]|nr:hypothetical protein [Bacteroidales bacterium]